MPTVDLVVSTPCSRSIRARQVQSMFDVPEHETSTCAWKLELPIDAAPWNVGLVVGPSGSGKSSIMREVWGEPPQLAWSAPSVIDDFAAGLGVQAIADACSAIGFNTIPAWLRPFGVLSNGAIGHKRYNTTTGATSEAVR